VKGLRPHVRVLPFAALIVLAVVVPGVSVATGMPWSGSTYRGHGTGAWPKDTAMLKVSPAGTSVPTYLFKVDTLCGKDNVGGRETYIWPVNGQGSPPLVVRSNGSFFGKQGGSFTVPRLPTLTTGPEPGSYRFSVSGAFTGAGKAFSGHMSLSVTTKNGYFCSATKSTFVGLKTS
jgi:hypothetical protein